MVDNGPSDGFEMVSSWNMTEGRWYSYARNQWTALKLRVALTFFGEPDRLGEINHAVDALAFYEEPKKVAIERIAKRIWKQVVELGAGTDDGLGASIAHCRIAATDGTPLPSVLCMRLFFERSPNLRTDDVRYVDVNGAAHHCWRGLVSNRGPQSNSDAGRSTVSWLQTIQNYLPSSSSMNNKAHACDEQKPKEVRWNATECVRRLSTDVDDGPSQIVYAFMGHLVTPSVKRMAWVLFMHLNVLLEMQDVEFILSTNANKEKLIQAAGGGEEALHACLVEMLQRQGIPTRKEGDSYLVVTLQDQQPTAVAANSNDKEVQTSKREAQRPVGLPGTSFSFCCGN